MFNNKYFSKYMELYFLAHVHSEWHVESFFSLADDSYQLLNILPQSVIPKWVITEKAASNQTDSEGTEEKTVSV